MRRRREIPKRRTLGDVIGDAIERAEKKKQKEKAKQKYPVSIIYEEKTFSIKGKKETYYVFALKIDGSTQLVSQIKKIGKWSGIKQVSGKTIINYAAKGKTGKTVSRDTVSSVIKAFRKVKGNDVKVGIDHSTVLSEDGLYFREVLEGL